MPTTVLEPDYRTGYAPINGLEMYYEIHGSGQPLVLVHGGGSTIQSNFGRVLPAFAMHRKVIALELQAHGRTHDRDGPESFEQDADDVAGLLGFLKISQADFFGFSNGGNTVMQLALRHPALVRKIVLASAFFQRDGMFPGSFESLAQAQLTDMPPQLAEAYLKVAAPEGLTTMFHKDRQRMLDFQDWTEDVLRSINAPTLILSGDRDVVQVEHAAKMSRLIKGSRLLIIPGGHGVYIGEVTTGMDDSPVPELTVGMIFDYLDSKE